jgi:outer membrane cobalamin receptor
MHIEDQSNTVRRSLQSIQPTTSCRAAVLLLVAIVSTLQAHAAEPGAFELGKIVVTGKQPRVVEQAASIDTVTQEDIRQSGARNLNQSIALLPGVFVRTGGDGVPRIDMRGLRTRHVTLLLDGIPFNSTMDGQFDPSAIDVADIDHIEVVRGSNSVLYGPGGNAGTINIITKTGGTRSHGRALAELGTGGEHRAEAEVGGGSTSWHGFLSASGYHRDDYRLSDSFDPTPLQGSGDRVNSDRSDANLYGNSIWKMGQETDIGLSASYRRGHYGKPFDVRDSSDPFARNPKFERLDNFEGYSLQLTGRHQVNSAFTVRPIVYANRLDEVTNDYDNASFDTQAGNGAAHQDSRSDVAGGRVQTEYDWGSSGQTSTSFDCRRESWRATGFQISNTGGGGGGGKNKKAGGGGGGGGGSGGGSGGGASSTGATVTDPINVDEIVDVCSVGVEQEYRPYSQLGLVGGLGYATQSRPASNDSGAQYLLGAYHDLTEQTQLRALYSSHIRFPTLLDLFEPGRGNPDLNSERTYQYEVGMRHDFTQAPASVDVALFRTDARDFIERSKTTGLQENISKLRFQGVEVQSTVLPADNLTLRFGYTYLDSTNLSADAPTRKLQNRPEHQFTVETTYRAASGFEAYASLLHVAKVFELSRSTPTTVQETGDYTVVNVKLSQEMAGGARVFARVDNLFDENYAESGGLPAPGRAFFVGGEIRFNP